MSSKIRIYEIAKELGVENSEVIGEARELGIEVKSHSSTVTEEESELIKQGVAELQKGKDLKTKTQKKRKKAMEDSAAEKKKTILIRENTEIEDIASQAELDKEIIVKKFKKAGFSFSSDKKLDIEEAALVLEELGYKVKINTAEKEKIKEVDEEKRKYKLRAPVVTVMGHVDHGKTQLLDTIRKTDVIKRESGGITQHIGASKVTVEGKGDIVFIDTPGHEAFTAMRARGAQVTDIVVLVVAADDGVMPQTVEAINHARSADVPVIVAINKMDLPDASAEKVRTQLSHNNIITEEYGGDVISVEISAKENKNIDEILEMIMLQAEMMELRAPVDGPAKGVVIESELDKRIGPTATVIITEGILNRGDAFICGMVAGKVKAMADSSNKRVKKAGPSTPVSILGFEDLPQTGDKLVVMEERTQARGIAQERRDEMQSAKPKQAEKITLEDLRKQLMGEEKKELNIILKTDMTGSMEAIKDSVMKLSTDEVKINVIHSGVGSVTKKDIMLASASDAVIIGFNISVPGSIKKEAEKEGIQIRKYRIIYDIIEDIKKALEGMLKPAEEEVSLGRAEVKKIFKISGVGTIAGCGVFNGVIRRNASARVIRDSRIIYEGNLAALKRFKKDVSEVASGYECGMNIENFNDIKVGDVIESYEIRERKRTLEEARKD